MRMASVWPGRRCKEVSNSVDDNAVCPCQPDEPSEHVDTHNLTEPCHRKTIDKGCSSDVPRFVSDLIAGPWWGDIPAIAKNIILSGADAIFSGAAQKNGLHECLESVNLAMVPFCSPGNASLLKDFLEKVMTEDQRRGSWGGSR